jgi:peptide deformylase
MALIVQAGEEVLRQAAGEVPKAKLGTPELRDLIDQMISTMREAPGVGLAAPQIGVPLQVLVMEDDAQRMAHLSESARQERERTPFPLTALINPTLELLGDARATFFEGCLSVSGWTALVPRALEVIARGLDASGAPVTLRVRGWPARILQHEVDHLRGTLYVDRMLPRSFSRVESAQRLWTGVPTARVMEVLAISETGQDCFRDST